MSPAQLTPEIYAVNEGASHLDQMRRLRMEFCREHDPAEKQEIFDRLFLFMAARWRQLVELAAEEQDPFQLNLMIGELNAILRERRTAIEIAFKKVPAPTDTPVLSDEDEVTPLHMTVSSSR